MNIANMLQLVEARPPAARVGLRSAGGAETVGFTRTRRHAEVATTERLEILLDSSTIDLLTHPQLHPDERVSCPCCGSRPALQIVELEGRDGALHRIDYVCSACGFEHAVWC